MNQIPFYIQIGLVTTAVACLLGLAILLCMPDSDARFMERQAKLFRFMYPTSMLALLVMAANRGGL
jgi:hypothetical protein